MVHGSRLLAPLGYVPPAEFEQAYHDRQTARRRPSWRFSSNELSGKPGAVHSSRAPAMGRWIAVNPRESPELHTHYRDVRPCRV
jgi:hypothetical protein